MKEFEQAYDSKTHIGYYHKVAFVLCCICYLAVGSLNVLLPFLTRQIQLDLDISFLTLGFLQSCMNLGGLVGGIALSILLPRLGRKTMLCVATFVGAFSGVFIYYTDTVIEVLFAYFLGGVYIALVGNSVIIFIVELFPEYSRGKLIIFLLSFFSVGRVFGSVLLWLTLEDYEDGLWRLPLMIVSIFLAFVFPGMLLFMRESVKYSFMKGDYHQAAQDHSHIQSYSHDQSRPSNLHKVFRTTELQRLGTFKSLDETAEGEDGGAGSGESMKKSQLLWMVFFFFLTRLIIGCLADGHVMAISNIMGTDGSVLIQTIGIMSGEFVAVFIAGSFIDNPRVGRKRLVKYNLFAAAVVFAIPIFLNNTYLFWYFYLSKICLKVAYSTLNIHIAESLPTEARDRYMPLISTFGECMEMAYPLFFFQTVKLGTGWVFGGLAVFALVGFISSSWVVDDLELKRKKKEEEGVLIK